MSQKISILSVCLLMLLLTGYGLSVLTSQVSVYASVRVAHPLPSTGLTVLAQSNPMTRTGLLGGEITFAPENFERALDLASFPSLTVTSLPPLTDGELRLGSVRVREGQTIARGEVERLSFVPAHSGVRESAFYFCVGERGYSHRCILRFTDRPNAAPTVEKHAIRGICEHMPYRGRLLVTDPEGDATRCMLTSPPAHGALIWLDAARGSYCYIPAAGYAGEDRFAVVATDRWGNMSAQIWVEVRIGVCGVE